VTALAELVHRHALLTMEKQLHAADVIGERPWQADLDAGTIAFGDDLEMRAQLLGTEAQDPGSWLWSWANGFEPRVTAAARRLRDLGAAEAIAAFTDAELALSEEVNATRIAFAAVGVLAAQAFYSAPAGGGTRAVLLLEHPDLALPQAETVRLAGVLTSTVQTGEVADWPAALQAYASQRGLALRGTGAHFELGDVRVTLDELGRVLSVVGRSEPSPGRRRLLSGRRRR